MSQACEQSARLQKSMVIDIEKLDDVCILRCKGRFATGTDPEYLCAKADEVQRTNCMKVLADFCDVPHIGSMGISFVVGLYSSVLRSSGRFVLVGLHPRVREVFDLTRLSTIIPLAADVASGLAALRGEAGAAQSAEEP